MPETRPLTAAGYIRVSTEDQTEYSPEAQKKALLRYASDHGMRLDETHLFVDEGISGRTAEKRPAFLSMIAQAKSKEHPFDVILVHRFDRFARSREDSVVYKSMLKKECGVRVISITESIEDDKFSVILEAMLEAMAEYYSINLSDEVRKGMTEKAARGELQSAPAFGYAAKNGALEPVPEEAAIVVQLFQRFAEGAGALDLAKWVNSLGVKSHRGNPFSNRTVSYILQNPVYIGQLRWTPNRRRSNGQAGSQTIIAQSGHPPLISRELWDAAQEKLGRQRAAFPTRARASAEKKHWLCGIVRCAACGQTLAAYSCGPNRILYFKCLGYSKGECPSQQHIRVDLLENAFFSRLKQDCLAAPRLSFAPAAPVSFKQSPKALLQRQIDQTERRLSRLREAFLAGAESAEEYAAVKEPLGRRLAELKEQLSLPAAPEPGEAQASLRSSILDTLETLRSPSAGVMEQFAATSALVDRCTFQRKPEPVLSIWYKVRL